MQTSGARNTDPSRKNAHQYRPLTQALRDRGCRREVRERGGKRVDAQFTGDPKQPHGDKSEYRPLTQGREGGNLTTRIPTAHARSGGEGLENTDLPHRECRPFAQGITDRGRKGLPTAGARDYRLPAQERRRIQTARTSNTDLSRKAAPGTTCKSMHFADWLPFPCCSCLCLMFCCSKKSGG